MQLLTIKAVYFICWFCILVTTIALLKGRRNLDTAFWTIESMTVIEIC